MLPFQYFNEVQAGSNNNAKIINEIRFKHLSSFSPPPGKTKAKKGPVSTAGTQNQVAQINSFYL